MSHVEINETKIEDLFLNYKQLNINERGQFIGALIGECNLLKEMGIWFEPNPFTTLFKTEFEKGAREKVLISLAEIDITYKENPLEIFWIQSPFNEQNVLFQQIMRSKEYQVTEQECILEYDATLPENHVEISSQYPLAFRHIEYDSAVRNGTSIKGTKKVKMKGYLAERVFI